MATSEVGVPVAEAAKKVLFPRMIDMGRDAVVSMKIMAFLIWLETHEGFQDIIAKISPGEDGFLNLAISEAEGALASLQDYASLNATQNLAQSGVSLAVFLADKQKALSSFVDIYKRFCCVLFEDIMKERRSEKGLGKAAIVDNWNVPSGVGSIEQNKALDGAGGPSSPLLDSNSNPSARKWNPLVDRAPEEDRWLFLTFSNGYPLNEDQIFNFFTKEYGLCVDNIYVHRPEQHTVALPDQQVVHGFDQPLFGKVVFLSSSMPPPSSWVENKKLSFWLMENLCGARNLCQRRLRLS